MSNPWQKVYNQTEFATAGELLWTADGRPLFGGGRSATPQTGAVWRAPALNSGWARIFESTDTHHYFGIVKADNGNLVARVSDGSSATGHIWVSEDNGDTWFEAADLGRSLSSGPMLLESGAILVHRNGHVWTGIPNPIYRSVDHGYTWVDIGLPPTVDYGGTVTFLTSTPTGAALMRCQGATYRSTDDGVTWVITTESPDPPILGASATRALVTSTGAIIFGESGSTSQKYGIVRSADDGLTWTKVFAFPTSSYKEFRGFAALPSGKLLGFTSHGANIYESYDDGVTWTLAEHQLPSYQQAFDGNGIVTADGMLGVVAGWYGVNFGVWINDEEYVPDPSPPGPWLPDPPDPGEPPVLNTHAVALPGYAGTQRGTPIPGSDAAWDEIEYPADHSRGLQEGEHVHHTPEGVAVGDGLWWDGTQWIPLGIMATMVYDVVEPPLLDRRAGMIWVDVS